MVSDVRQKLSMRFNALVHKLMTEILQNAQLRERIKLAQVNPLVAQDIQRHYRSEFCRAFPGCTLTFGREYITIGLPSEYPNAGVPVMGQCPPGLVECLRPRGLANTPF